MNFDIMAGFSVYTQRLTDMRENKRVPVVAMRGKVILPGKTDHFEISRKKSMAAV